jgi:hypothetical protein
MLSVIMLNVVEYKGGLLALSTNNRLWKWLTVTNTLAYYDAELFTTVKRYILQGHVR